MNVLPLNFKALRAPRFLAGVLASGLIATAALHPALAQRGPGGAGPAPGIDTPFGRAPLTFADLVEKVRPAVVSISVSSGTARTAPRSNGSRGNPSFPDIPEDHPLYEFFKQLPKEFRGPGGPGGPGGQRAQAQGSGFVISEDGYVVTNEHVIKGAGRIQVSFDGDNKFDAELVGADPRTDLALLKIKANQRFPYVRLATKSPRVGDWVLAVGNPFGFGGTVTAGIVSALGREVGAGPYEFMQIDAAVNKGNSGGPTFNLEGEVVGVNTAIYSPSGGNVGIAFAIPAKTVQDVISQLLKTGSVARGWLGVAIGNVDEDTAESLGLKTNGGPPRGALIGDITAGGPAEAAGLKRNDIVLSVNGQVIKNSRELAQRVAEIAPGTTVAVEIIRDGRPQTVQVRLGTFPGTGPVASKTEPKRSPGTTKVDLLGLTLAPLSGSGREGVAITEVNPDSHAASRGLKAGDVILEINNQPVSSIGDVESGIKRATDAGRPAVMLRVKTAEGMMQVPVRLEKTARRD
ncbi:MAG TPA: Do family serine endopeptidase [Hyphomicrobiaceae bacterium]|nr:Do family serine endopeptidase [Hyphomicrobiaceae bacterium]